MCIRDRRNATAQFGHKSRSNSGRNSRCSLAERGTAIAPRAPEGAHGAVAGSLLLNCVFNCGLNCTLSC
eukprot:5977042-Alexandrium_andersonii.AAC.1